MHFQECLENAVSMLCEINPHTEHLHFGNNCFTRRISNSSSWSPCSRNMHIYCKQWMLCHPFTLWCCLHVMEASQPKSARIWEYKMDTEGKHVQSFHLMKWLLSAATVLSTEEFCTFSRDLLQFTYIIKEMNLLFGLLLLLLISFLLCFFLC